MHHGRARSEGSLSKWHGKVSRYFETVNNVLKAYSKDRHKLFEDRTSIETDDIDMYIRDQISSTESALKLNPEIHTVWNYRRLLLVTLFIHECKLNTVTDIHIIDQSALCSSEDNHGSVINPSSSNGLKLKGECVEPVPPFLVSCSKIHLSIDRDAIKEKWKKLLIHELELVSATLRVLLKSYCVWQHRIWVLWQLMLIPERDLLENELSFCNDLFEIDDRNYHAWCHRLRVLQLIEYADEIYSGQIPPSQIVSTDRGLSGVLFGRWENRSGAAVNTLNSELKYSINRIKCNFSNYSIWHVRSRLMYRESLDFDDIATESHWIMKGLFVDPNDLSLWQYYDWFLLHRGLNDYRVVKSYFDDSHGHLYVFFSKLVIIEDCHETAVCLQNDHIIIEDVASSQSGTLEGCCIVKGRWQPMCNIRNCTARNTRSFDEQSGSTSVPSLCWKFVIDKECLQSVQDWASQIKYKHLKMTLRIQIPSIAFDIEYPFRRLKFNTNAQNTASDIRPVNLTCNSYVPWNRFKLLIISENCPVQDSNCDTSNKPHPEDTVNAIICQRAIPKALKELLEIQLAHIQMLLELEPKCVPALYQRFKFKSILDPLNCDLEGLLTELMAIDMFRYEWYEDRKTEVKLRRYFFEFFKKRIKETIDSEEFGACSEVMDLSQMNIRDVSPELLSYFCGIDSVDLSNNRLVFTGLDNLLYMPEGIELNLSSNEELRRYKNRIRDIFSDTVLLKI